MPCDNLAVQRLKLSVNAAAELLRSEAGLKTLLTLLTKETGHEAVMRESAASYHGAGGSFRAVWLDVPRIGLTLVIANGVLQIQSQDRALVARLTPKLDAFAQELAALLGTNRTIATLKAKHTVRGETRAANGTRTLKLTI